MRSDSEIRSLSTPKFLFFCQITGSGKSGNLLINFDQVEISGSNGEFCGSNVELLAFGLNIQNNDANNFQAKAFGVLILSIGEDDDENTAPSKPEISWEEADITEEPDHMINKNEVIRFTFCSSDSDRDRIKYRYSMTGSNDYETTGYYDSGVGFDVYHSYNQVGTYQVTVTAIDSNGAESKQAVKTVTVFV